MNCYNMAYCGMILQAVPTDRSDFMVECLAGDQDFPSSRPALCHVLEQCTVSLLFSTGYNSGNRPNIDIAD